MLILLCLLFEVLSLSVYFIMTISNTFKFVIDDYEYRAHHNELNIVLFMIAFFCGWFLAPYFIYLAYKYFKVTYKK